MFESLAGKFVLMQRPEFDKPFCSDILLAVLTKHL